MCIRDSDHPFRVGRSEDRLQGSDDVVDLRLAGPGKTVDEFLDLHRRNGFHVLHAKPRQKVIDKARLVIRSAGVGDVYKRQSQTWSSGSFRMFV